MLQEQIKVSTRTKELLDFLKLVEDETYDSVIQRVAFEHAEKMIEINQNTKEKLLIQIEKIRKGKVKSFNDILKEFKEKRAVTSREVMDGMNEFDKRMKKKSYPRGDTNELGS